ncbi:MAG TPA: hypothetical protein VL994_13225 [Steroidobacteraceae bacterium]|nr:hypothetical protein [Steroidobacteraceae bacterium]
MLRARYTGGAAAPLLRNCAGEVRPPGRPQEAQRHACRIARRGALAPAHRARTDAGDVAEGPPEGTEALPARGERDLGHRQLRLAQQRGGALDAQGEQVAVRRHPEGVAERTREVRGGQSADGGQAPHRPALVRGGVHAVPRAQQAAQEVGVGIRRRAARTRRVP